VTEECVVTKLTLLAAHRMLRHTILSIRERDRPMASARINARLPEPLADHVAHVVGPQGFYETPGEYIRSLIRRDMEETDLYQIRNSIREGYHDIGAGRFFQSSGDFAKDREVFEMRENND
jgi:antitoxin ParD1/3/4